MSGGQRSLIALDTGGKGGLRPIPLNTSQIERIYLSQLADAFVAIGPDDEVLYISDAMRRLAGTGLQHPVEMLPSDIMKPLRWAVERCRKTGERSLLPNSPLGRAGGAETFDIEALAPHNADRTIFVIVRPSSLQAPPRAMPVSRDENAIAHLSEELRFRELLEQAPFAIAIHSGAEHSCVFYNAEFHDWHPTRNPIGTTLDDRCGDHANPETRQLMDTAFRTGKAQAGRAVPFTGPDRDGKPETRYFTGVAQPYSGDDGEVEGVMTMTIEVTEEQQWRKRQELMVSELNHRVKNLLAIVQAVAAFSEVNATDKRDLLERLQDRLEAIGRANSHLIAAATEPRGLHELIDEELDQLGPELRERVHVSGPDILLPPTTAPVISLALHELTNNAVKHGAFSTSDGRVTISCHGGGEDGEVTLGWTERADTLAVRRVADRGAGFGVLLLTELVTREIDASAQLDFGPHGIVYEISFSGAGPVDG